jgi:hypothetical protein
VAVLVANKNCRTISFVLRDPAHSLADQLELYYTSNFDITIAVLLAKMRSGTYENKTDGSIFRSWICNS